MVKSKEIGWIDDIERAKKPKRLPVVFTKEEIKAILVRLDGAKWLMAKCYLNLFEKMLSC